jgi:dethiobiotin synthetase
MKPVETGGGEDAEILRAAAGNVHPLALVRPYAFPDPIAPLVAARRARRPIDIELLDRSFRALESSSDAIVVEGAGGLMVPFTETHSVADLFKLWELDVVIVAANRLGVVNHTLLTVDCARAYGLTVRAVVLNGISNDRSELAPRTNEALLKELLLTVPIVSFPYTTAPLDFLQLAALARDFSTQTLRRS